MTNVVPTAAAVESRLAPLLALIQAVTRTLPSLTLRVRTDVEVSPNPKRQRGRITLKCSLFRHTSKGFSMNLPGRVFAVLPAAGASRRMYTQKLLLPWGEATVLDAVLANWTSSLVDRVVVVCRAEPGVLAICGTWGVDVVQVQETPEMKDSIQAGLDWVTDQYAPQENDAWMLAPSDMPRVNPDLIASVIGLGYADPPTIALPRVGRHKGHPVFFPWSCADELALLGADEGVNAIVKRRDRRFLETSDQGALQDLDTPEQYARLRPLVRPNVEPRAKKDG